MPFKLICAKELLGLGPYEPGRTDTWRRLEVPGARLDAEQSRYEDFRGKLQAHISAKSGPRLEGQALPPAGSSQTAINEL